MTEAEISGNKKLPVKIDSIIPEQLIMKAIEQNISVETIEKLLAMRRELKDENAKEEYFRSLSIFQKECPSIAKDKKVYDKPEKGGGLRYSYAPLENIVSQVKILLENNGFSYTITTEQDEKSVTAICHAHHVSGHTRDTSFRVLIDQAAFMTGPQKIASALTFAKRYSFCDAFGIMTGDVDDDANSVIPEKKPDQKQKQENPSQSGQEQKNTSNSKKYNLNQKQKDINMNKLEEVCKIIKVNGEGFKHYEELAQTTLPTEFEKQLVSFIGGFVARKIKASVYNDADAVKRIIPAEDFDELSFVDALMSVIALENTFNPKK